MDLSLNPISSTISIPYLSICLPTTIQVDLLPNHKEFLKAEAAKRPQTVCASAVTGEGMRGLVLALEEALASQMEPVSITVPHSRLLEYASESSAGETESYQFHRNTLSGGSLMSAVHRLGSLSHVVVSEEGTLIQGRLPQFLKSRLESLVMTAEEGKPPDMEDDDFDWTALARGRHSATTTPAATAAN